VKLAIDRVDRSMLELHGLTGLRRGPAGRTPCRDREIRWRNAGILDWPTAV